MSNKKTTRMIVIMIFLILSTVGAILLIKEPVKTEKNSENIIISNKDIMQVKSIYVKNAEGSYSIWQENGGFIIGDIPMEQANADYLKMVLEESAKIEFLQIVNEIPTEYSEYGLEKPLAEVLIKYTDGEEKTLLIGNEEPISKNRYVSLKDEAKVFLIRGGSVIRFLSPVTVFISYQITPNTAFPSPFNSVRDVTISGTGVSEPIVIKAVESGDVEILRISSSFGAVTHLITEPVVHELDQGYGAKLFGSLVGLLDEKVVGYNYTDAQLKEFGFENPLYIIDFQLKKNKEAELENITIKVVEHEGDFLVVRDEQRIVHKISPNEAITNIEYEKMPLRWFLTPFITELNSVELVIDDKSYNFEISGKSNDSLSVTLNGVKIDLEQFRKYYILLISAENDGEGLKQFDRDDQKPLMELKFSYKDPLKEDDKMILYQDDLRKVIVEVNGISEFSMNEKYMITLKEATLALEKKDDFQTNW